MAVPQWLGGTFLPLHVHCPGTIVPPPPLPPKAGAHGTLLARPPVATCCEEMELDRLDRYLGVHAQALTMRSQRMELLASNIANAATPGYKARDMDFASMLERPAAAALSTSSSAHFATANPVAAAEADGISYRVPVQPSLDGNTVELATEQLLFTENAVRYRSTLSLLNGRISTLTAALKGE